MIDQCHFGDNRETMAKLVESGVRGVQCCVTAPPFFLSRVPESYTGIGGEDTPDEYVSNLLSVFSLVWRLLEDDGVLWLSLGDLRNGYRHDRTAGKQTLRTTAVKDRELIGIPWRVALALQAAGWYLRQDVIWHKINSRGEVAEDRCTTAHEYLFMLTKQPEHYWDRKAMISTHSVWHIPPVAYSGPWFYPAPDALVEACILSASKPGDIVLDPFFGHGTVGRLAKRHGRRWIGCEIDERMKRRHDTF